MGATNAAPRIRELLKAENNPEAGGRVTVAWLDSQIWAHWYNEDPGITHQKIESKAYSFLKNFQLSSRTHLWIWTIDKQCIPNGSSIDFLQLLFQSPHVYVARLCWKMFWAQFSRWVKAHGRAQIQMSNCMINLHSQLAQLHAEIRLTNIQFLHVVIVMSCKNWEIACSPGL